MHESGSGKFYEIAFQWILFQFVPQGGTSQSCIVNIYMAHPQLRRGEISADRPHLILIFVRGSWYLDVIWWMPSSSWNGQSLGQCHDVLNIRIKHAPFKEKTQKLKYTIKQINFKILLKWNFGSWTSRGRFLQFLKCNFSFSV